MRCFKVDITVALGDVVEFEKLPPGTAAWLCSLGFRQPPYCHALLAEVNGYSSKSIG
jgi:hypothetical protein